MTAPNHNQAITATMRDNILSHARKGQRHHQIAAAVHCSESTVSRVCIEHGLRRHKSAWANKPKPTRRERDKTLGTKWISPKALLPWPQWACFDVSERLRESLRQDCVMFCEQCSGNGWITQADGSPDACPACAARARLEAG